MADDARPSAPRDWEASTYDRVAIPHQAWGADVVGRLTLHGDETVLDAGCGTGRVTATLVPLVPRGRVIGVDGSPAMVQEARNLLPPGVELVVQDLTELVLAAPVDAVVSTATFHWIADHERLFARLATALRPGGRLEAQCGGAGNIASVEAAISRLRASEPWRSAFAGWEDDWNFASPEDTIARLQAAGFVDVRCWLEPRPVRLEDPYAFLRSVVLGSYLQRLPEDAQDAFVVAVAAELDAGEGVTLDYVRLNLSGTRRPEPPSAESPASIAARLRG